MVAHSQFCMSGDNTLEAASMAIKNIIETSSSPSSSSSLEETENQRSFTDLILTTIIKSFYRYVFILTDANFRRYGIHSSDILRVIVSLFLI